MTERASPPSLEEWLKRHKRVAEMLTKDDWVSVWIGLATFAVAWPFAASGVSVSFPHPFSLSMLCCVRADIVCRVLLLSCNMRR